MIKQQSIHKTIRSKQTDEEEQHIFLNSSKVARDDSIKQEHDCVQTAHTCHFYSIFPANQEDVKMRVLKNLFELERNETIPFYISEMIDTLSMKIKGEENNDQ